MHVGMSAVFQNPQRQKSDFQVYRDELRLADLAEPLGYQSIWGVEHHFTDYTMCPDVIQFLTYMAGRTQNALLGTMVVVLPWHDPVRVAEEVSMLDNISEGRMILGIGRVREFFTEGVVGMVHGARELGHRRQHQRLPQDPILRGIHDQVDGVRVRHRFPGEPEHRAHRLGHHRFGPRLVVHELRPERAKIRVELADERGAPVGNLFAARFLEHSKLEGVL